MDRNSLISLLKEHKTENQEEEQMRIDTLAFVSDHENCFERTLEIGHVTASGWIVSEDTSKVLLMHHRKLNKWFQPGGHCDGDPDVRQVARKEVEEETGLQDFYLADAAIFDVDIHLIPDNSKEKSHYHYDIRFLFKADAEKPIQGNIESREVKWISIGDVAEYNDSESLLRMSRKISVL